MQDFNQASWESDMGHHLTDPPPTHIHTICNGSFHLHVTTKIQNKNVTSQLWGFDCVQSTEKCEHLSADTKL